MAAIKVRNYINVSFENGLFYFLDENKLTVDDIQQIISQEIKQLDHKSVSGEVNKNIDLATDTQQIENLLTILQGLNLKGNEKILVIGASNGVTGAFLKNTYPQAHIVVSDFTSFGVKSIEKYEQIFNIKVDEKWVFSPADMPFVTAQFDLIISLETFCNYSQTAYSQLLSEINRVLKPSGKIILLSEIHIPKYLSVLASIFNKTLPTVKIFHKYLGNSLNLKTMEMLTREMLCHLKLDLYEERQKSDREQSPLFVNLGKSLRKRVTWLKKSRMNMIIYKPIYAHENYLLTNAEPVNAVK